MKKVNAFGALTCKTGDVYSACNIYMITALKCVLSNPVSNIFTVAFRSPV